MSMLSAQADELREAARGIQGNLGRCLYRRENIDEMQKISGLLFEAADTILSLRDRLQESYGQVPEQVKRENGSERESCGEDNSCAEYAEGMGRYADSLCDPLKQRIAELEEQRDMLLRCLENDYGLRASWDGLRRVWTTESVAAELDYIEDKSRWHELFGTPERAAETMFTLMLNCARGDGPCERCPAFPRCNWASDDGEENESMMLEWIRGDA